jgi:hypothetical protein
MKTKQHKQDIGYGNQCLSEENLFFSITQATISLSVPDARYARNVSSTVN